MAHELETQRLLLVPFADGHVDALHALWTNPEVRRYLWEDEVIPRSRAEEMVAASQRTFEERGFGFWSMFLKSEPESLMGFCGFRVFEETDEPELLYGILPRAWGKGYVTEAGHAAIRFGFEVCGFERILAATDTPNQSSVNVMQRLGMIFESRRQFHGLDTVFYSISPADHADFLAMAPLPRR
ncbi:MAG TPA: GNAT family N-acetyltransferase [Pseudomonadales bacterium]|nr:GNAT family N-acetyltransferase [Pseudomonadales bacterium]